MDNIIDPQLIFNELSENATTRTKASLTVLHEVLDKVSKTKPLDFSIANVGQLSEISGGPSTQTIRNRTGKHFQQLIEAWATFAGTTRKKPLSVRQKQLINTNEQSILDSIDDPVIRAVVGTLIAERNKYRDQINIMKANADIVVDRTHANKNTVDFNNDHSELTPMEKEALEAAISADFMQRNNWKVLPTGQVKDCKNNEIYKRGYVNSIAKLIAKSN